MTAIRLPAAVAELVDQIAGMPGAVAVVLGGSRAGSTADAESDWDLGLYYRGEIDLSVMSTRGVVHPSGAWGRIMNGGAWLDCDGFKVDVILRDLEIVEHWTRRAQHGEFEVDALLGYVAGAPTYILSAELASCRPLHGDIEVAPYPPALIASAPARWRFCRTFSLDYARMHAKRGSYAGAIAHAARAVMEEAHAVLRARRVGLQREAADRVGRFDRRSAAVCPGPDRCVWSCGVARPRRDVSRSAGRRGCSVERDRQEDRSP
jgi:hypothetical protein